MNEMGFQFDWKDTDEHGIPKLICNWTEANPKMDFLSIPSVLQRGKTFGKNDYWFGFIYNSVSNKFNDFRIFRNKILKTKDFKTKYEIDYLQFIEYPIEKLYNMGVMGDVKAIVHPEDKNMSTLFRDITDRIRVSIKKYLNDKNIIVDSFTVFKKKWLEVTVDNKEYKKWLRSNTDLNKLEIENEIDYINSILKGFQSDDLTKDLPFAMKHISYRDLKLFVRDFFKFNETQKKYFEWMQPSTILIIDDIVTNGSTIDEISRLIHSINSDHKIIRLGYIDMNKYGVLENIKDDVK